MRANSLVKISVTIEGIYTAIEEGNKYGCFKHGIPHNLYVSDEVKLKLMADGFKVYNGDWDGVMKNSLIIEW